MDSKSKTEPFSVDKQQQHNAGKGKSKRRDFPVFLSVIVSNSADRQAPIRGVTPAFAGEVGALQHGPGLGLPEKPARLCV